MVFKQDPAFGYSEYWRKNRSSIESQELSRVLLALRKAGKYIAVNLKTLEWSGMSAPHAGKIELNIGLGKGEYPLSPGKMDILVGITVREAFHCKVLSDMVWLKIVKKLSEMTSEQEYLLGFLVNLGEDIFINYMVKDTVWRYYLPACWPYVRLKNKRDVSRPPTIASLLHIVADYILSGKLAVNMNPGYHDLFQKFIDARDEIIDCIKETSISKRCDIRVNIYQRLWQETLEAAKAWDLEKQPEDSCFMQKDTAGKRDDFQMSEDDDDLQKQGDDREKDEIETDIGLTQQINEALEELEGKSIDKHIEDIAVEEKGAILETFFLDSNLRCRIDPDQMLVSRLKRIFQLQRSIRSRRYHYQRGLHLGKIDGRRLYRFVLDGRVFRKREYSRRDNTRNIVILVDGSASMAGGLPGGGKEWTRTERVFASLFEAVKGTGNRLDVLAYYERGGVCEVTRLSCDNKLYTVRPEGRTPTGQAIVAAALKMPKDKQRLIIHITDGEPNCGLYVKNSLEFCDGIGVEVVTIGAYYNEKMKAALENQYGNRAILVDSLNLLPLRLEEVLRASLLKQ